MFSKEKRLELRKLIEEAKAFDRDSLPAITLAQGCGALMPQVLDTIDALEAENERLKGQVNNLATGACDHFDGRHGHRVCSLCQEEVTE